MQSALRSATIDEGDVVHFIEIRYRLEGGLYPMPMEIPVLNEYFENVSEVRDGRFRDQCTMECEDVRSLENEIIVFLDKEKTSTSTRNESINVNIKMILEDIRRMAEHASDIAEAALNETVNEVIEKISTTESKTRSSTDVL
ncbi:MAG: hypothetical protein WA667_05915 [Candidatus Nitrosopolaris sp.]